VSLKLPNKGKFALQVGQSMALSKRTPGDITSDQTFGGGGGAVMRTSGRRCGQADNWRYERRL
jgi:hypothetical protein